MTARISSNMARRSLKKSSKGCYDRLAYRQVLIILTGRIADWETFVCPSYPSDTLAHLHTCTLPRCTIISSNPSRTYLLLYYFFFAWLTFLKNWCNYYASISITAALYALSTYPRKLAWKLTFCFNYEIVPWTSYELKCEKQWMQVSGSFLFRKKLFKGIFFCFDIFIPVFYKFIIFEPYGQQTCSR